MSHTFSRVSDGIEVVTFGQLGEARQRSKQIGTILQHFNRFWLNVNCHMEVGILNINLNTISPELFLNSVLNKQY